MISGISIGYLIENWLSVLIYSFLVVTLIVNFARKKTTGTLLLLIAYSIYFFTKLASSGFYTIQIIMGGNTPYSDHLQLFSTTVTLIGAVFFYIFGTRHILKDGEIIRNLHVIIISIFVGILGGLIYADYFLDFESLGWSAFQHGETGIYQPISAELSNISINIVFSGILAVIISYVFLRLSIRALILSRRTDKLVRKRGLQMIGWGLMFYFLGGLIGGLFFAAYGAGPWLLLTLYIFRSIILTTSYVMMYIGWIMPNWFTRYIRGKSWFEQRYKEFSKIAVQKG
ncbi:MAG: hypothetical protein ACFFDW_12510 [Candidatus Thorarchaeota archaeon]